MADAGPSGRRSLRRQGSSLESLTAGLRSSMKRLGRNSASDHAVSREVVIPARDDAGDTLGVEISERGVVLDAAAKHHAGRAGLRGGDRVIAVNGEAVEPGAAGAAIAAAAAGGAAVTVLVERHFAVTGSHRGMSIGGGGGGGGGRRSLFAGDGGSSGGGGGGRKSARWSVMRRLSSNPFKSSSASDEPSARVAGVWPLGQDPAAGPSVATPTTGSSSGADDGDGPQRLVWQAAPDGRRYPQMGPAKDAIQRSATAAASTFKPVDDAEPSPARSVTLRGGRTSDAAAPARASPGQVLLSEPPRSAPSEFIDDGGDGDADANGEAKDGTPKEMALDWLKRMTAPGGSGENSEAPTPSQLRNGSGSFNAAAATLAIQQDSPYENHRRPAPLPPAAAAAVGETKRWWSAAPAPAPEPEPEPEPEPAPAPAPAPSTSRSPASSFATRPSTLSTRPTVSAAELESINDLIRRRDEERKSGLEVEAKAAAKRQQRAEEEAARAGKEQVEEAQKQLQLARRKLLQEQARPRRSPGPICRRLRADPLQTQRRPRPDLNPGLAPSSP